MASTSAGNRPGLSGIFDVGNLVHQFFIAAAKAKNNAALKAKNGPPFSGSLL